jgi:hypothetical protein
MTLMLTESGHHHRAGGGRRLAPKAVALKVSASLSSVNLFAKPLLVSDGDSLRDGRYKTFAFAGSFTLAAVVLIAFYASKETVFQQTVFKPSLHEYQSFEGVPSCVCSQTPRYGDGLTLNIPGQANFSTNVCNSLTGLQQIVINHSLITSSNPAALMVAYLTPLAAICFAEQIAINLAVDASLTTEVGPTLLDFPTFNHTAFKFVTAQLDAGFTAGAPQPQATMLAASSTMPTFRSDASYGALARTPANCTCSALTLATATPLEAVNPCQYQASFDTRTTVDAETWWDCNFDRNTMFFPAALLLQDAFYNQFGIPPSEYRPLQQFAGAENVTAADTFQSLFFASLSVYYPGSVGRWDYSRLQPGLLTIDYASYYSACAPQSCIVTYSARPSAIQLITIMLGVISGLQTLLMLTVDKGYDFLLREYCRRRARSAAAAAKLPRLHESGRTHDNSGNSESDDNSDDSDGGGHASASVAPAFSGAVGDREQSGIAPAASRPPVSATGPVARAVVVSAR